MNKVIKQHELTINISAQSRTNIITNTTFFSMDINTGKKIINFTHNNTPVDLTNATVLMGFEFVGLGSSKIIDSKDGSITIQSPETGQCEVMLPNHFYTYTGQVLIHVYIKFEDGRSLDAGIILTEFEESWLDQELEEMTQFYVKRFEDLVREIREREATLRQEMETEFDDVRREIANAKTEIRTFVSEKEEMINDTKNDIQEFKNEHKTEIQDFTRDVKKSVNQTIDQTKEELDTFAQGQKAAIAQTITASKNSLNEFNADLEKEVRNLIGELQNQVREDIIAQETKFANLSEEIRQGLREKLEDLKSAAELKKVLKEVMIELQDQFEEDMDNILRLAAEIRAEMEANEAAVHDFNAHIEDEELHMTPAQRANWQNKFTNIESQINTRALANHTHNATAINAGTLAIERIPTGTTATTVALGNHTHPAQTTITGNAATATTLQTQRTINGTNFNGSANITTANWGSARNITIGNLARSVNGSANVSWSLADIGAAPEAHINAHPLHNRPIQTITDWNFTPSTNAVINAAGRGEDVRVQGETAAANAPWSNTVSGIIRRTSNGNHWVVEVYRSNDTVTELNRVARRFFGSNGWTAWIFPNNAASITAGTLAIGRIPTGTTATTVALGNHTHPAQTTITGNASTATTLQTARTISLTGAVTGSVSFNGSANAAIATTQNNLATVAPLAPGTAAVGTATRVAREDHRHPFPSQLSANRTITLSGAVSGSVATNLSGNATISTAVTGTSNPAGFAAEASPGTSSSAARRDHVHAHPTQLRTARTINGTSFNGTANITTANWGTARDITIGNTTRSVNGSGNLTWSLANIGALPAAGGTVTGGIVRTANTGGGNWTTATSTISGDTRALVRQQIRHTASSEWHPIVSAGLVNTTGAHAGTWSIGVLRDGNNGSLRFVWYAPGRTTNGTDGAITFNSNGTINAGAIPSLPASRINDGTFAIARIPTGTTATTVALGNHTHTAAQVGAAPASAVEDSGWINLPLASGASAVSGWTPQYRRIGRIVHLRGAIFRTGGGHLATLPTGHRPVGQHHRTTANADLGTLTIETGGNVTISHGVVGNAGVFINTSFMT